MGKNSNKPQRRKKKIEGPKDSWTETDQRIAVGMRRDQERMKKARESFKRGGGRGF